MERDAAHCPFCSSDAVSGDVCRHLIADFGDGTYDDHGIMCKRSMSRSGNAALLCLKDVERTLIEFAEAISPAEYLDQGMPEVVEANLVEALGFVGPPPSWFGRVLDDLRSNERPNEWTVKAVWSARVPWSARLVATTANIGTMASTDATFVWAEDPAEGAGQIANAMEAVVQEVVKASARVSAGNWLHGWTRDQQIEEIRRFVSEFLSEKRNGRYVLLSVGRLDDKYFCLTQCGDKVEGELEALQTVTDPVPGQGASAALAKLGFKQVTVAPKGPYTGGEFYARHDLDQDPVHLTALAAEVLRLAYKPRDDYMVAGFISDRSEDH